MECVGVRLLDPWIEPKKGYFEGSWSYELVAEPENPELCADFIRSIKEDDHDAITGNDTIVKDPNVGTKHMRGLEADFIRMKRQEWRDLLERERLELEAAELKEF